jgi:hypothetical protein
MSNFIPNGYQSIAEWLQDEEGRRRARAIASASSPHAVPFRYWYNPESGLIEKVATQTLQCRDDLANYLGQGEREGEGLALCIDDNGHSVQEVPLPVWRFADRAWMATGRLEFRDGFGMIVCTGRVVIRRDLRMDETNPHATERHREIIPDQQEQGHERLTAKPLPAPGLEKRPVQPAKEDHVGAGSKKQRKTRRTVEQQALEMNKIRAIVARAKVKWPELAKAPGAKLMSDHMHAIGMTDGLSAETTRQILEGRYGPQKKFGIKGYFR